MFNELKLETKHNACFVAGTLVHTDKGLIPIQDIKVGDKVLSRDEHDPNGELVYKSVLKTIKTPNQEVFRLSYWARNQYDADEPIINYIIATRDHPIWNEAQERWCPLIDMEIGNMLSISNKTDTTYHFLCNNKMYQSSNSKGVLYGFCERPLKDYLPVEIETIFEVTDEKIISYYNPLDVDKFQPTNGLTLSYEERCDIARNSLDEALLCDVYNIEIEDCHTYFVGEEGVWVHDVNVILN